MDCMEETSAAVSQAENNLPHLQETVTGMIKEHPEDAARLVSAWLVDDDSSGRRNAAILLVIIGLELSVEIYKYLREDEIETLTFEIARLDAIGHEKIETVLQEFHKLLTANRFVLTAGIDYARELLENSLGSQKAIDIINRLTQSLQVRPFDFIRRTDPEHLLNFVLQEHPQTIALVLAYLEPNKASVILQNLPGEIQCEVTRRIAIMGRVSPEVLREVERVLEKKLSALSVEDYTAAGGVESTVEILNLVDRYSEKQIIESLEDYDPELAEEIKKNMFVFEDIVMLDDRMLQKVLREVDSAELAKALKAVDVEVQDKIFKNMSKRVASMVKMDMEYMGPIRLMDVEKAQSGIISIIRHLEDTGEIIIARAGEDDLGDIMLEGKKAEPKFEWSNILSLSRKKIEKVLQKTDYETLVTALKLTRTKIYKKLTEPLGFFKRLKLKSDIKRLKDIDVDEVIDAQNDIVSIIQHLRSTDIEEESSEDIKEEVVCLKC